MAVLITPATELEAVNTILRNAGVDSVNTLDDDVLDVEVARAVLKEALVDLQTEGWWFNTEHRFPLTPNGDDRLVVPANTLKADVDYTDRLRKDYVLRGNTFYDRENHTYDITEPTTVTLVRALPFNELPSSARRYITMRSARQFQAQEIGDPYAEQSDSIDETNAMRVLRREEMQAIDANALRDNLSTLKVLSRTRVIIR